MNTEKPTKITDEVVLDRYSNKIQDIRDFVEENWKGKTPFDYTFLDSVADQIVKYKNISVKQMGVVDKIQAKLKI